MWTGCKAKDGRPVGPTGTAAPPIVSLRRPRYPGHSPASAPPHAARGSALLAVLWLSAALAAIAFSLANTVRGETDRVSTAGDGLRAYHLAAGAVQSASLHLLWAFQDPAGTKFNPSQPMVVQFPSGAALVEFLPETGKLDLNAETPETFFRLLSAMGAEPARAREAAFAIDDWRTPLPQGTFSRFDQYYLAQVPSFRANHSSFLETEELLLVKAVTPELYYGTWVPNPNAGAGAPRLIPRGGLRDCVSVFGSRTTVDVNTARPEVLLALGLPPDAVNLIVERRRLAPFTPDSLKAIQDAVGPAAGRLGLGGATIWTIRATAQLRLADGKLSDLRRTVAAQVKYMPTGYDAPMHILRWYDTAWSN
jgi:general secretion pathway protein K